MDTMKKYSWDGGTTRLPVNDEAGRELLKDTVGFTGKNRAYSQTNNAVIASIESGKSYTVSWTGSATITLKKDSASGTEVTSGSTSPLTFTADADYDLYFGSSDDVTQIMVCDSALDGEYEEYHDTVETMFEDVADDIDGINLLENKATSKTLNNVTFTVNNDKTVTINTSAAASANTYLDITSREHGKVLNPGTYILSGFTGNFSGWITITDSTNTRLIAKQYNATPVTFTVTEKEVGYITQIRVSSGQTVSNDIIKPMITTPEYAGIPYHPYNQQSIQHQINDITGVTGVGNFLENRGVNEVVDGVTFTNNADYTITINGTSSAASGSASYHQINAGGCTLEPGTYVFSMGDAFYADNEVNFGAYISGSPDYAHAIKDRDTFTLTQKTTFESIRIFVRGGKTCNVVAKPRIKLASDPDDTYVPFAMTNRELTEVKTYNVSYTGASLSISDISFDVQRVGKVVQFGIFFNTTSQLSAGATVELTLVNCPLPSYSGMRVVGFTGSIPIIGWIENTGKLKVRFFDTIPNNSGIVLTGTYITND